MKLLFALVTFLSIFSVQAQDCSPRAINMVSFQAATLAEVAGSLQRGPLQVFTVNFSDIYRPESDSKILCASLDKMKLFVDSHNKRIKDVYTHLPKFVKKYGTAEELANVETLFAEFKKQSPFYFNSEDFNNEFSEINSLLNSCDTLSYDSKKKLIDDFNKLRKRYSIPNVYTSKITKTLVKISENYIASCL